MMQSRAKQALVWLIGIVIVVGLVYSFAQVTTLTCERVKDRVDCAVQSRLLGLVTLRERAVQDVTGAQVAESCDEDGCTYRVELLTRAGMTPLTSFYTSGSAVKSRIAREVNAFVRDATLTPLQVRDHFDPTILVLPALFIVGPFLWRRWQRYTATKHAQFVHQVANGQQTTEGDADWGAELVKKGFLMYRCFAVTTPDGRYVVEYNPRGVGYETVLVDGEVAQSKESKRWFVPQFEFKVGPANALLTVRVWPWFAIRSLKLIVAGRVLYTEGAAAKTATPEELADLIAEPLRAPAGRDDVVSKAKVPMPRNVTCDKQPTGVTLTRRWFSGIAIFLLFFSLFWNGIVFFIFGLAVLPGTEAPWFTYLILLPFLALGLYLAYYTLTRILNKTVIQLTASELSIQHGPLPWPGNRLLPVSGLKQLYCKEVISRDYEGDTFIRYHLLAVLSDGQEIELLKGIESPETVRYLEQEIENWLNIEDMAVAGEMSG